MRCVFAGYPAQMEEFMKLNPSFKRRIRAIFTFDDFTCEELAEIFMRKLHFHAEALCLQTEIMLSLIRRKPQQTDFLKVISNPHITLSSFLELKRWTHWYTAVVNGTRLQANKAQNSYPLRRHIPIWFISGPSPRGKMTLIELHYFVLWTFNAKMNE